MLARPLNQKFNSISSYRIRRPMKAQVRLAFFSGNNVASMLSGRNSRTPAIRRGFSLPSAIWPAVACPKGSETSHFCPT